MLCKQQLQSCQKIPSYIQNISWHPEITKLLRIQWLWSILQQLLQQKTFYLLETRGSYLHHLFHFFQPGDFYNLFQAFPLLAEPAANFSNKNQKNSPNCGRCKNKHNKLKKACETNCLIKIEHKLDILQELQERKNSSIIKHLHSTPRNPQFLQTVSSSVLFNQ